MRSLNNFRAERPNYHAMYYLHLLMTEVAWTKDELREALDGETLNVSLLSQQECLLAAFSSVDQTELIKTQNKHIAKLYFRPELRK